MSRYANTPFEQGSLTDMYELVGQSLVNEILKEPTKGHFFFEWKGHGLFRVDFRRSHRKEVDLGSDNDA